MNLQSKGRQSTIFIPVWDVGTAILRLYLLPVASKIKANPLSLHLYSRIDRLRYVTNSPPNFSGLHKFICHSRKSTRGQTRSRLCGPCVLGCSAPVAPPCVTAHLSSVQVGNVETPTYTRALDTHSRSCPTGIYWWILRF